MKEAQYVTMLPQTAQLVLRRPRLEILWVQQDHVTQVQVMPPVLWIYVSLHLTMQVLERIVQLRLPREHLLEEILLGWAA